MVPVSVLPEYSITASPNQSIAARLIAGGHGAAEWIRWVRLPVS